MNKSSKVLYSTNVVIKLLCLLNNKSIDVIAIDAGIIHEVSIQNVGSK